MDDRYNLLCMVVNVYRLLLVQSRLLPALQDTREYNAWFTTPSGLLAQFYVDTATSKVR